MAYVRGHAGDYNRWGSKFPRDEYFNMIFRWEKEGAKGWNYESCLPYFKKAQTHQDGEDAYRGGEGPLHVSRGDMGVRHIL